MHRRLRSKSSYLRQRDLMVYAQQSKLCREHGLRSKHQLGKYLTLVRKYRSLSRRQGVQSKPYLLAQQSLRRKGILPQGGKMEQLTVQNFLARRLQTLVQGITSKTIRNSRQLITTGKVRVRGYILRSPSALIPRQSQDTIVILNNQKKH